jgi:hypothetical protein
MSKTQREGAPPAATTTVRVLPQGDGRIFTGAVAANTEAVSRTYRRGEIFDIDAAIAEALERRGLVEIQP